MTNNEVSDIEFEANSNMKVNQISGFFHKKISVKLKSQQFFHVPEKCIIRWNVDNKPLS